MQITLREGNFDTLFLERAAHSPIRRRTSYVRPRLMAEGSEVVEAGLTAKFEVPAPDNAWGDTVPERSFYCRHGFGHNEAT